MTGFSEIPLCGRYGQGKVARVDDRFADAVRAHKWYLSNDTGLGVAPVPAAAIVGVWIYCLLWMVILDVCKFAYWRLPTRDPMIQRASLIT